jgi:hypothetical protein
LGVDQAKIRQRSVGTDVGTRRQFRRSGGVAPDERGGNTGDQGETDECDAQNFSLRCHAQIIPHDCGGRAR